MCERATAEANAYRADQRKAHPTRVFDTETEEERDEVNIVDNSAVGNDVHFGIGGMFPGAAGRYGFAAAGGHGELPSPKGSDRFQRLHRTNDGGRFGSVARPRLGAP